MTLEKYLKLYFDRPTWKDWSLNPVIVDLIRLKNDGFPPFNNDFSSMVDEFCERHSLSCADVIKIYYYHAHFAYPPGSKLKYWLEYRQKRCDFKCWAEVCLKTCVHIAAKKIIKNESEELKQNKEQQEKEHKKELREIVGQVFNELDKHITEGLELYKRMRHLLHDLKED